MPPSFLFSASCTEQGCTDQEAKVESSFISSCSSSTAYHRRHHPLTRSGGQICLQTKLALWMSQGWWWRFRCKSWLLDPIVSRTEEDVWGAHFPLLTRTGNLPQFPTPPQNAVLLSLACLTLDSMSRKRCREWMDIRRPAFVWVSFFVRIKDGKMILGVCSKGHLRLHLPLSNAPSSHYATSTQSLHNHWFCWTEGIRGDLRFILVFPPTQAVDSRSHVEQNSDCGLILNWGDPWLTDKHEREIETSRASCHQKVRSVFGSYPNWMNLGIWLQMWQHDSDSLIWRIHIKWWLLLQNKLVVGSEYQRHLISFNLIIVASCEFASLPSFQIQTTIFPHIFS